MLSSLDISQLYHPCDTSFFSFTTTDDLEPLEHPMGKKSALDAIDFAADIQQEGFNLFAMGPSGSGKHSSVMSLLRQRAEKEVAPRDWCYVNNFKDSKKPIAIDFPSGEALQFKEDIIELVELLKAVLPTAFESNTYQNEREATSQKYIDQQTDIFKTLQEQAKKHDVAMSSTLPTRVTFAPIINGKVLSSAEFKLIEGEEKEKIIHRMTEFETIVKENLRKVSMLNKAQQKELKALERKTTQEAVEALIDEMRRKYQDSKKVLDYLGEMENNVIRNVQDFLLKPDDMAVPPFMQEFYAPNFERYNVNLFISHDKNATAPVIYEDNPIHQNLIGRVEHASHVGTLVTDFNMIKAGALHKANGGYLILDARKVLMQPFAYEGLKRVLKAKKVCIESLAQQYSFISTTSLEPEPIPVNLKVVLLGERILYYLLHHYDPDFQELFKVVADFENEMPRSNGNVELYARMIATLAKGSALLPLTPEAVARVIEQSSREVEHSLKFSTHLMSLSDLLKEADYWSKKNADSAIQKSDIEKVLLTRKERLNRIQMKLYEQIDEGTIMINIKDSAVGQINALSYLSLGGYHFGLPSRKRSPKNSSF
jgi:predicted ATP-dependent protease